MDYVDHFLKKWNNSKGIEEFLDQKIDLPSPDVVRDYLEILPEDERTSVYKELVSILQQLETHVIKMEQGLDETEEKLSQVQLVQDMCVSYEKADAMNNKSQDNKEE